MQYPGDLTPDYKRLLLDFVKMAWLAYSEPQAIAAGASNAAVPYDVLRSIDGRPEFVQCPECDAQGYLCKYNTALVLAVRGTTSIMDWMCDADIAQTTLKTSTGDSICRVHAGFHRQFQGLRVGVDRQVRAHLKAGGRLICVGHSLGAAVATLAALYYASEFQGQVQFAGFGSPRAVDPTGASLFDARVINKARVKNASDPVPASLPPVDYKHVGRELHLGPTDQFPDIPLMFDVGDHDIAKYAAALASPEQAKETKPASTLSWLRNHGNLFTVSANCSHAPISSRGGSTQ